MIVALLIAAAPVAALADDPQETACYAADYSQQSMNRCAGEAYQRADANLNRLWAERIADARECDRSPDCGRTEQDQRSEEEILQRAQRAWIQFRDAQCEFEGLEGRGGSIEPMIVAQCLARLTRERIQQLTPDGD